MKKLDFLWHLVNLENDTLAKEILTVQKDHNLPGLVSECTEWIQTYDLPNIMQEKITKPQWKSKVKAAILKANENDLRSKMMKYEKLKSSDLVEESVGTKPYLKNLSVHQARIIFKKRVSMMQHVKMNYMSDMNYMKSMWLYESCQTCIDSMDHVLWCHSYTDLRSGKNLKDDKYLARYLHDVFKIRSNPNIDR